MSTLDAHEDPLVRSSDEPDGDAESNLAELRRSHRQQLQEAQFQSLYVLKPKLYLSPMSNRLADSRNTQSLTMERPRIWRAPGVQITHASILALARYSNDKRLVAGT